MKRTALFILLITILSACSKDKDQPTRVDLIDTRFFHELPTCPPDGDVEPNCGEFIDFINNTQADILLGGGDIVFRVNYLKSEDKITLDTLYPGFIVSFTLENPRTLRRIEDNTIWKKQ
jgi:hypothetical protein